MKIADVMTTNVEMIGPDAKLPEIARRMRDEDIGILPIADDDHMLGVVTDRDIVTRGLADGRDPNSISARDVMSDGVLYCFADQSTSEVLDNLADVHVRRLPVVDRDKRLVGIVSLGDLATAGPLTKAGTALREIREAAAQPR